MSHRRSCHRAATPRALRDTLPPLRTLSSSVHVLRADAGNSRSSSHPGSDRVPVPDRRTRASTGYRRALPRRPDQTDCTTAAGNRCATSPRSETLDGRLEDPAWDNPVRSPPPALTTAPSPPSRLETRRALCASSCLHNLASRSSAARPYCRPRIKGAVCHDPEVDQRFLSYIHQNMGDISTRENEPLRRAAAGKHASVVRYLHEAGAATQLLTADARHSIDQMKHEMQAAPAINQPSAFWKGMGEVNERILGWSGEGNFKRTLNQNYFN